MSARVKYGPGWRGFKAHLEGLPQNIQQQAAQIVEDTVREGAQLMEDNIDRIDTGLMHDSVSYTVPKRSYFYGRFGWGLNGEAYEDYFRYQEQGTRTIAPMHAMYRAFLVTRERFFQRIQELTK